MVVGLNTDVKCLGVAFHVQTEDLGGRRSKIQTVVFHGGTALAKVETSHAGLDLTPEQLAIRLEEQHERLVKQLRAGRLDLAGGCPTAPEPTRRVESARPAEPVVASEPVEAPRPPRPVPMNRRRFDVLRLAIEPRPRSMWFAAAFAVASWGAVILSFQSARGLSTEWNTVSAGMSRVSVARLAPASPAVEPPVDPLFHPVSELPLEPSPAPTQEPAAVVPPTPAPRHQPPRPAPKRSEPTVEVARLEPPPPVATPRVRAEPVVPVPTVTPPPPVPEPPVEAEPPPAPPRIRPGQLVDLAAVDVMPRPVQRDLPTYTKRAKRKKQEGRVALELLIHETGRVAELRLRETIPGSDLNDTVIESAWHWRFVPASKSGVPVRVWKPVTVDFSIVSGQTRVHISE